MSLSMPIVYPKSIFSSKDDQIDYTNAVIFLLLLDLSQVCYRYPKGSHYTLAINRSKSHMIKLKTLIIIGLFQTSIVLWVLH